MDVRDWPNTLIPRTESGAIVWVISLYVMWAGLFNYVLAAPPAPGRARSLSWVEAGPFGPDTFGWLMVAVGAIGLIFSYCRRGSVDTVALPTLMAFSFFWGFTFFVSWVVFDASFTDVRGLLGTWWLMVFGTLCVVYKRMKGNHC